MSDPNSQSTKVFTPGAIQGMIKKIDKDAIISPDAEVLVQKIAEIFINDVCTAAFEECKLEESDSLKPNDIHVILQQQFDLMLPGDIGIDDDENHMAKPLQDYTDKLIEVRKYLSSHHDE
ncbi:hypothetical protein TVAG_388560 [Trichomonas vaginalis G3]|uniref:Transcription initiation factor TFIID subunit 12 domain-containing protein n=1 Tax=Trichomonas vaginalis (strain ATCC PRA-98 / G3) TaxID=412133 RepID=A2DYI9_TRIV3|nr:TAF12 domain-containing protein [Trichomonas vaginalis G3]EAY14524.1 hypothetical protein TVAG_388560 [Trichomonas vaginalis G3]KAI5529303.1 TAF12 domain-containing protein [Trichomonas vaginalis G3]|eukprot:XP_001326747.1 hypothetical protein [Trichomonas vaginalis G3]